MANTRGSARNAAHDSSKGKAEPSKDDPKVAGTVEEAKTSNAVPGGGESGHGTGAQRSGEKSGGGVTVDQKAAQDEQKRLSAEVPDEDQEDRSHLLRMQSASQEERLGVTRTAPVAGSGDQGPGTGTPASADTEKRMQDRMHTRLSANAAPITAPDAAHQMDPEEGHARSSTDPVLGNAATAVRNWTGDNFIRLVKEDGSAISDPATIFAAQQGAQTFRVVNFRVFEEFAYKGAPNEPMRRLLYNAGQKVPLLQAQAITEAVRLAKKQRDQEVPPPPVTP